jgi:two-component system, chemotaxis family, protein-glutamate methylesterase/glutaminase
MYIFCEECGKKMNVNAARQEHPKYQKFQCAACGEILRAHDNGQAINIKSSGHKNKLDHSETESFQNRKVLLVDDSPLIRGVIRKIMENSNMLKVVGEASNGAEALDLIPRLNPDVITLDINMPVMDGLTTLKHMMIKSPKPAVMISTLTREGASVTFDALKYGAIDFITKPSQLHGKKIIEQQENIVRKVSLAANVETGEIRYLRPPTGTNSHFQGKKTVSEHIFTIGASEGGYSALLKIVPLLRPDIPAAVLVVLYAEPIYVDAFVQYLNDHSMILVKRAKDREPLFERTCYIASGHEYLTVEDLNGKYFLQVNPNPFPNRKGAINMLMMSVAENFGKKAVGAILSGEGDDGIEGLREILRQGGQGLVQDPKTCLYKDMVLSVLKNLPIDRVVPDRKIANEFNQVR